MRVPLKRIISLFLSVLLVFSCSGSLVTAGSEEDDNSMVLFSTSFEIDEVDNFIESTVYNNKVKNIGKIELTHELPGDVTGLIVSSSISGSPDFVPNESKPLLFDYNTGTKFLTAKRPSASDPVVVSFMLMEPKAVSQYLIASANDFDGRDPVAWTFYGSNDGNQWIALDTRSGVDFPQRFQKLIFTFQNTTAYKYYKLEVTENAGEPMTQFSEFQIATGQDDSGDDETTASPMKTRLSQGPSSTWCNTPNTGWTGFGALQVLGQHQGSGEAYCSNVIYNVDIPVGENTNLSYVIFPALYDNNSYDFEFTSMYIAVDLAFDDGTYLSDLGAVDQNGNIVSPVEQGKSKTLWTMQWNYVKTNIGEVAAGKTIKNILISYKKPDNLNGQGSPFLAYIDDIVIETSEPVVYDRLSDYVNILRGTNSTSSFSRGLTAPLVTMPHGFNFYVPVTNSNDNNPYRFQLSGNNNTLRHITVSHIASNWIGDFGTWQFMANSNININSVTSGNQINADARKAQFKHANEIAKAHYYSVTFDEGSAASGVKMEVTPTMHAAFVRFTFPANSTYRNVIFDCERGGGSLSFAQDKKTFTAYSDHTQNGSKRMYVYGEFLTEYESAKVVNTKQGIVSFPQGTTEVVMKIATSFISPDQAKKNLELEISSTDTFDTIREKAQKTWDDLLGIIEIEGATHDQMVTFYSCMYRLFAYPNFFSENTGTNEDPNWKYCSPYSGSNTNPTIKSGILYINNGFWDTYRTTWAAYALLTPSKDSEMLNGLVQHYIDCGWVPRWIAPGGTNSMVGTSSDVIFGDAIMRGIEFDYENAFKSALKNAAVVSSSDVFGRKGLQNSVFRGYTSTDTGEGFSWSIESYINDYGISQLAKALGYEDEAEYYLNRSLNYVNLYNKNIGFFMGKNADGTFRTNDLNSFNPANWWGDYTETNAWNMSFSIVHDGQGLANLYGGREKLKEKLDGLFNDDLRNTQSGEIHEMKEAREVRMGQYGHSNQPSHHLPYMYNYAGAPYRTQEVVREILARLYVGSDIGQGYCGDEDNGEMSAWYIFSALGFYPVSMGNPEFAIGSPLFKKATIHLENGKDLVISAPNNSRENIYVQSVKFNGKEY
ncbi:MAG TPA: glycoside hydrolase family 92 protein, partial [Clostridiales bacterium]|nr:glycoside hydrolase family 92 protein [Clostridiales bacterium]